MFLQIGASGRHHHTPCRATSQSLHCYAAAPGSACHHSLHKSCGRCCMSVPKRGCCSSQHLLCHYEKMTVTGEAAEGNPWQSYAETPCAVDGLHQRRHKGQHMLQETWHGTSEAAATSSKSGQVMSGLRLQVETRKIGSPQCEWWPLCGVSSSQVLAAQYRIKALLSAGATERQNFLLPSLPPECRRISFSPTG
jgi:hypothetical protein